jgi:hypothetical protein
MIKNESLKTGAQASGGVREADNRQKKSYVALSPSHPLLSCLRSSSLLLNSSVHNGILFAETVWLAKTTQ